MFNLFQKIWSVLTDALFPFSSAENQLFSYSNRQALAFLPQAPDCPIPNTYSIFHYKDERVAKLIWHIKYKKSVKAVGGGWLRFVSKDTTPIEVTRVR